MGEMGDEGWKGGGEDMAIILHASFNGCRKTDPGVTMALRSRSGMKIG